MGFYRGQDGTITVGGTAPTEIRSFSVTTSADPIESMSKGQKWKATKSGHIGWSGTASFNLDYADAKQVDLREAIIDEDEVALVLFPAGNGEGMLRLTGNAVITEHQIESPEGSSSVTMTVSFVGNGALTES